MNKIETVPAKEFGTCRNREGFWVDCLPDKETHTISSKDDVTVTLLILLLSVFFGETGGRVESILTY
jgi:hypothetical protein